MSITDFFNSSVDIQRVVRTDDDIGGQTEDWPNLHTGLACCIQPRRGFEIVAHDKRQAEVTHIMYCKPVDILPSDRINNNGVLYDVLLVRNIDMLGRFLTLNLKEVVA